ncbi:hypothetical protein C3941_11115 [Kaistia algarum]|uniref:hypothetical protein n=1 Tax=Kaistia algarum TaxID=2083279 RepID=UPI000CE82D92|nr:hypothetical protein [Kaistia algarum]MCX5514895.1 hypothetical protein [Kaistia algarum]PPE79646.1 hypothetical protein C3941_11115 [Kaistia algarum]
MHDPYDDRQATLARIEIEQQQIQQGELKRYDWRDGRRIDMTRRWFEILQAKATFLEKCIALETRKARPLTGAGIAVMATAGIELHPT